MRTIDTYLSRRAQLRLDPSSIVTHEDSADWQLRIGESEPVGIGDTFREARQALDLLIRQREAAGNTE